MPGPSFLPFGSALGAALLFVGVVVGGWVLIGGLVCVVVGVFGWLHAARAEWRATEEADRTGHMRNEPAPGFPMRMFVFFTVVMIAAFSVEAGFIPPRATIATAGAPARAQAPRRARARRRLGSAWRLRCTGRFRRAGRARGRRRDDQGLGHRVHHHRRQRPGRQGLHHRLRQRGRRDPPQRQHQEARTGATRSRARSSPGRRRRSTRCRRCPRARIRSSATSTRT